MQTGSVRMRVEKGNILGTKNIDNPSQIANNYWWLNIYHSFFQDILQNKDVKLDHMFIASLVSDIVRVRNITVKQIIIKV
jgi:hypothetical protein